MSIEKVSISTTKDAKVLITLLLRLHSREEIGALREKLKGVSSVREVYAVAE